MKALFVAVVVWMGGCNQATIPVPGFTLEQMNTQPRCQTWEHCAYFPDGRTMQPPPQGTLPREAILDRPALTSGAVNGQEVTEVPLPMTRARLLEGRRHFEVACALCHGFDGSGESIVASKMRLRRPPPLIDAAARALPAGRIFNVISNGYGLMPPLYDVLSNEARWEVVAYVKVLQQSRAVPLASLPAAEQARAKAALR